VATHDKTEIIVARKNEIQIANFICKFGKEKVLLDYVEEIVIPAFKDEQFIRKHGKTRYLFRNIDVLTLDSTNNVPQVAIVGRFIKDGELSREKRLDLEKNRIVDDYKTLQSTTTAFFVLILNSHRIIYYPETAYPPTLSNLKSTCRILFKEFRDKLIAEIYTYMKEKEEKITKSALEIEHPAPEIEIVPLSSEDSINEFINRFDILKYIRVDLLETNDEVDSDNFFKAVRGHKESINSTRTSLIDNNSNGLDKEKTGKIYKSIASAGNHKLTFSGIDHLGEKLRGNNEDFNLRIPVDELPEDSTACAESLYSVFTKLHSEGMIKIPKQDKKKLKLINYLAQKYNDER
jgi:hypothetical protein